MRDDNTTRLKRLEACRAELERWGQAHVLRFWDELTSDQRDQLLDELQAIPWALVGPLVETHVKRRPEPESLTDVEPAPVYPARPVGENVARYDRVREHGRGLIALGTVAAFTVAGGQGTRLAGFDGPKGLIPITPVRSKSLFQLFAETILAARARYRVSIPWYIMTSPDNHARTEAFFREHDFFGLPETDVWMFPQGMLPAFDFEGRLLMRERHRLALAPDGHGGSLKALAASGALADMRSRGIQIISYFQVDNPLVKPFDPLFIGLHAQTASEASTKVTSKAHDQEPVGHLCLHNGRVTIIEYTVFPAALTSQRTPDGTRRFDVANLAIHLFGVAFVERVMGRGSSLPFRRAEKIVPYVDEHGRRHTPDQPNAVKLETFVFDVLPLARNPLALEVDRAEEFSPVKRAHGEDSVDTAKRDQIRRATKRLEQAGVGVPRNTAGEPDAVLELAPAVELEIEETGTTHLRLDDIKQGDRVYVA